MLVPSPEEPRFGPDEPRWALRAAVALTLGLGAAWAAVALRGDARLPAGLVAAALWAGVVAFGLPGQEVAPAPAPGRRRLLAAAALGALAGAGLGVLEVDFLRLLEPSLALGGRARSTSLAPWALFGGAAALLLALALARAAPVADRPPLRLAAAAGVGLVAAALAVWAAAQGHHLQRLAADGVGPALDDVRDAIEATWAAPQGALAAAVAMAVPWALGAWSRLARLGPSRHAAVVLLGAAAAVLGLAPLSPGVDDRALARLALCSAALSAVAALALSRGPETETERRRARAQSGT